MDELRFRCMLLCVCLFHLQRTSGGSLVISNGAVDNHGVEQHILQLKTVVSEVQTQLKEQAQTHAALMTNLLSRFASTSSQLANLKSDFVKLEAKHNTSVQDISFLRNQLSINSKDLSSLKPEFKTLKTDFASLSMQVPTLEAQQKMGLNSTITYIADLKKKNDVAMRELNTVKNHQNSTDNALNRLQSNITTVVSEISSQNVEIMSMKENIQKVLKNAESTAMTTNLFRPKVENLEKFMNSCNANISALQNSVNKSLSDHSIDKSEPTIAFSCVLTNTKQVKAGQTIKYDHVILNSGNGFNKGTGVFTCPLSGIYRFYIHVLSEENKNADLILVHKGNVIARASGHGQSLHDYDGDGNSAIIQAMRGDPIWVKTSHMS